MYPGIKLLGQSFDTMLHIYKTKIYFIKLPYELFYYLTITMSTLYSWDMKKLVAEQTTINTELKTTDQGSRLDLNDGNIERFSVEIDRDSKQIKLFVGTKTNDVITMDDHTRLERIFNTLLSTVKQKITFWKVN